MHRVVAVVVALFAVPGVLYGQWSVTAQVGVHSDRLSPPQRVSADAGSIMMSAPGEAPVVGLRVARVLSRHLSADIGVAVSQNRSWSGGGPVPLPGFAKRTTFTSATVIWRPLDPASGVQLSLGAGPALVIHGGSGESMLSRQVDVGGLGTAGASVRLSSRLRLGVDVQNYRFSSRFGEARFTESGFPSEHQAGTHSRSEWVILPSLRIGR